MPNSHFVKRVLQALEDVTVKIDYKHKGPRINGSQKRATYDPDTNTATLYRKEHSSYEEMVLSLLHEAWHSVTIKGQEIPEYIVEEALDRVSFTSPRLRWAASEKIGTVVFKF